MTKSKNVSIQANKVEISTKQTTVGNSRYPAPAKPRLGLIKVKELKRSSSADTENVEKELGFLSTSIESQVKYGKSYCIFNTILVNADPLIEKIKAGGYEVIKLDDKVILVRW